MHNEMQDLHLRRSVDMVYVNEIDPIVFCHRCEAWNMLAVIRVCIEQ